MQYIRSCSNCLSELKFPIDRGVIRVRCPECDTSFIVDPDDPVLYTSGRFVVKDPEYNVNSNNIPVLNKSIQNKIIITIMFIILAGYFLRDCSLMPNKPVKTENIQELQI